MPYVWVAYLEQCWEGSRHNVDMEYTDLGIWLPNTSCALCPARSSLPPGPGNRRHSTGQPLICIIQRKVTIMIWLGLCRHLSIKDSGNGSYFKDCLCGGTCTHRLLQIIYVDAITIQANFYISLVLIKVNKIEQKFSKVIVTHDHLQTWLGVAAAGVTERKIMWCGPCPHIPYAIHLRAQHMAKLASPYAQGRDWAAWLYHAWSAIINRFCQPLKWRHGQHPTLKMCRVQLLDDCNADKLVTGWRRGLTTYGKPCVLVLPLPINWGETTTR